MVDYANFGQGLQSSLASNTMFWLVTIALVFFIIAVMIVGFKKVARPGRLKWFILHTLSIFLIGYFLKDFVLNKYLVVLIFAIGVTLLSTLYRYLIFHEIDPMKRRLEWFVINLIAFMVIQILYEVINVTDNTLKLFFASFCLTLIGALLTWNKREARPFEFNRHHRRHRH